VVKTVVVWLHVHAATPAQINALLDDGVTVTPKHVGAILM